MRAARSCLDRLVSRLHIHQRGRWAERLVLMRYLCCGYYPIRTRGPVQIDLLLRRGRTILLIEVKYRRHPVYRPLSLRPDQRQRLHRAARMVAGEYPSTHILLQHVTVAPQWPFLRSVPFTA